MQRLKRASEKEGRSECNFRLIIRLRNTCQVSPAYILLEVPCSIRRSGVSSIKGSKGNRQSSNNLSLRKQKDQRRRETKVEQ